MPETTQPTHRFYHPATGCLRCPLLVESRHTVVWGRGPTPARYMLIGEAPGYNEDTQGEPFVGRAGAELTTILRDAGLDMSLCHIANVLMCRPENNRDPFPDEVENCDPWLTMHVREVDPELIFLFGRWAISRYFGLDHLGHPKAVGDTQGLMYLEMCDTCGRLRHEGHAHRTATIIGWTDQDDVRLPPNLPEHSWRRRLVCAIYHPASVLGGRNPENRPKIVHQIRRALAEVEHLHDA